VILIQNRGIQQKNPLLEGKKTNFTIIPQSKFTVLLILSSSMWNPIPWLFSTCKWILRWRSY